MNEVQVLKSQPAVRLIKHYFENDGKLDFSSLPTELGVSSDSLFWAARELLFLDRQFLAYERFAEKGLSHWELKPSVIFAYLSLLEYEVARKDAKRAQSIAYVSMAVAVLVGIGSILAGIL